MSGLDIALLHPCYWPEVQRGLERLVHEHAVDMVARGHKPRLLTSHPGPPRTAVEDGFEVVRHWRPPERFLRHRGVQEYVTHLPFTHLSLARRRYDVAHAFFPGEATLARRWSRRTGRPSVFTYGGIPERAVLSARRGRMRLLEEAIFGCDAVVALTRAAADALWRWFGVRARIIAPGVRLERFQVAAGRDERPTILCTAAPDDARKRIDLLLAAFRRVRRERPDARLVLAPGRSAAGGQIEEGVAVIPVGPEEVAGLYQQAWVTALPSRNEAFGLVLVESLACGTPVVGTNHGGIPEIIDRPGIGSVFDGGEVELAAALLSALDLASDARTAERCRVRAADFTTDRAAAAYEQLYLDLLGSP